MKDLKWLKREVDAIKLDIQQSGGYCDTEMVYYDDLKELIDQVEQPDYNDMFDRGYKDGYKTAKNQIPEQPELPVIPDFVAEWIEKNKGSNYNVRDSLMNVTSEINEWLFEDENMNDYIRAWLDGYTVEEKKYRVWNGENIPLIMKGFDDEIIEVGDPQNEENYVGDLNRIFDTCFTKQEIKEYDERYFAFAVPVEEEGL